MQRVAFVMRLKEGGLAEYKHHHDNIWAEMITEMENSGIAQITIFENDPMLVLYSEVYDDEAWTKFWNTEVHDRWSEIMNPLMFFNTDGKVDSTTVREIFHVETSLSKK